MNMRKIFVVGAAVAALGVAAGAAIAQSPSQKAVQTINTARRQLYTESAAAAGTTTEVAAARMFESQLLPRMTTGQWYRNAEGQWVRR